MLLVLPMMVAADLNEASSFKLTVDLLFELADLRKASSRKPCISRGKEPAEQTENSDAAKNDLGIQISKMNMIEAGKNLQVNN